MARFKKNKYRFLFDGFKTTFDLFGFGFERRKKTDNINDSWYIVGGFFTKSFDDFKILQGHKTKNFIDRCN